VECRGHGADRKGEVARIDAFGDARREGRKQRGKEGEREGSRERKERGKEAEREGRREGRKERGKKGEREEGLSTLYILPHPLSSSSSSCTALLSTAFIFSSLCACPVPSCPLHSSP
jgi:hypothetical protein